MANRNISDDAITYFQDKLLSWFEANGRHHFLWRQSSQSAYEIVIAEILLQRTKAETIEKFYPQFLSRFPSWASIVSIELETIEEILKPIGLYKQRAKRLHSLAMEMEKIGGQFPNEREELEKLPFLGQYIVNAIELQLFSKPSPLLDVNMARVLERYFGKRDLADIRYDPYLQELAKRVVSHAKSKELSWAILDFAAVICKAREPLCKICILNTNCQYYASYAS